MRTNNSTHTLRLARSANPWSSSGWHTPSTLRHTTGRPLASSAAKPMHAARTRAGPQMLGWYIINSSSVIDYQYYSRVFPGQIPGGFKTCSLWRSDPKYHLEQKPQLADALAFAAPTCPKGLVIDVGANGSKETSSARAKGYRVLAVECLVPEYLRLQAQWLHDPMITLLSGCASDAVGLHRFHHASAGSSLHKAAVSGDAEARMHAKARSLVTNVPSFPLDPMLEAGPLSAEPLCVLKVDVQGHEIFVLRGVARSIRKHRPVVIFEYDPRFGPQARGASARVDHLRGNWIRLLTLPVVAWVARPGERNDSVHEESAI